MFQLPPWAQAASTALVALLVVVLVYLVTLPRRGRALVADAKARLEKTPDDAAALRDLAKGKRWLRIGSDLRALRDSPQGQALPPIARLVLDSLPESDPPPASVEVERTTTTTTTVKVDPGKTPVGPRKPPPLPLLCLFLLVTGCTDLTYARSVRDASHDAAALAAPIVDEHCVERLRADLAEVRALPEHSAERERRAEQAQAVQRERRCPQVVAAYDALRVASITLDATVAAAETGQCMSARGETCDVGGAAVRAAQAMAAVAGLVAHLEKSR